MKSSPRSVSGLIPLLFALFASACTAAGNAHPDAGPVASTVKNSLGMTLVLVPAGEFVMGADEPASETRKAFPWTLPELLPRESPAHKVRITKPFYMGRCEVTLGQFRRFVDDAHYKIDAEDG